jgi:hypothetical protein
MKADGNIYVLMIIDNPGGSQEWQRPIHAFESEQDAMRHMDERKANHQDVQYTVLPVPFVFDGEREHDVQG